MSRAPSNAGGFARNPLTPGPSSSRPCRSPAAAECGDERPKASGASPQISTAIAVPPRDPHQAGLGRHRTGQRVQLIVGVVVAARAGAAQRPELAVERHAGQMRADHPISISSAPARGRRGGAVARRFAPSFKPLRRGNRAPKRGEQHVPAGGASSVTPNGMPSALHRCRHGEAAQVEQVDEVGVGAEPAVESIGIGQHLRRPYNASARSAAAAIDRLEGGRASAAGLRAIEPRTRRPPTGRAPLR